VEFMVHFYEEEELASMVTSLALEACSLDAEARRDHFEAYEGVVRTVGNPKYRERILNHTSLEFFDLPDAPASIRDLGHTRKKTVHPTHVGDNAGDGEAAIQRAYELCFNENKHEEALACIEKFLSIDPGVPKAWVVKAKILDRGIGDFKGSEEAYRKAIKIDQKSPWVWVNLGDLLHEKLDRLDEAEEAYRKALEIDPKFGWAWVKLGDLLHEKLDRLDEAEEAYRKALEIDPKFSSAWMQLGMFLHERLDRNEEAEEAYRKALESEPRDAWAWSELGKLLIKLDRFEEARNAFKKTIEIDPEGRWEWETFMMLEMQCSDNVGGFEETLNAFDLRFGSPPGKLIEWVCLNEERDFSAYLPTLVESARKLAGRKPDDLTARFYLACVLVAVGDHEEGLALTGRCLVDEALVRRKQQLFVNLFARFARAGRTEAAIDVLEPSPASKPLEPLLVALKIHAGMKFNAPQEVEEVAKDVARKFT